MVITGGHDDCVTLETHLLFLHIPVTIQCVVSLVARVTERSGVNLRKQLYCFDIIVYDDEPFNP